VALAGGSPLREAAAPLRAHGAVGAASGPQIVKQLHQLVNERMSGTTPTPQQERVLELAAEGFTRLTYEIADIGKGTSKLTVTHDLSGAPHTATLVSGAQEAEGAGGGWPWVLSDLKTLLETGARASELVQLRVEDVSLAERVVTIHRGKGAKRREVPIRRELEQLLRLHIGTRRAGPVFASRQEGHGPTPHMLTRQRVGQIVRDVARANLLALEKGDNEIFCIGTGKSRSSR